MKTQTISGSSFALPDEIFMFVDANGKMLAMGKKSEVIEFGAKYLKTFMYYYEEMKNNLLIDVDK